MYILCIATHFVDSENMLTEQVVSQKIRIRQCLVLWYVSYCAVECCSSCHVIVYGKSESGKGVSTVERKKLLKFMYFVKIRGDEFAVLSQEPSPV
jgi:hypothetical protein